MGPVYVRLSRVSQLIMCGNGKGEKNKQECAKMYSKNPYRKGQRCRETAKMLDVEFPVVCTATEKCRRQSMMVIGGLPNHGQ
jgi:hypothetical protein